jgi:membrane associated rhomboid family serine protease
MVMPLWDHSPFRWPTPPYVMWSLIAINFGVFFWLAGLAPGDAEVVARTAGLVPAALFGGGGSSTGAIPAPLTLITCLFLHGNFMHVFGNMIFLFVFGDDIEEALGHWRFLAFYFACGIGSGFAFALSDPSSTTDLIGASGAIAGVVAAYLLFRRAPRSRASLASFRFGCGPIGSSAAGRSGSSSRSPARSRTVSPTRLISAA